MKRRTTDFRTQLMTALVTAVITLSPISKAFAAPQQAPAAPAAAQAPGIPRLVRFSGTLKNDDGKIPSGNITMTFSLYQDQEGGNPLWTETEPVGVTSDGHYSVLLGATDPGGLPADLFNGNKPRWVGVVANAPGMQSELPRVLLVGVPYALKAADSETLGGKPASAYVTTDALSATTQAKSPALATTLAVTPALTAALAGTGTTNFLPIWTNSTTLGNSTLFETGNNVGIGTTTPSSTLDVNGGATVRGLFQLPPAGTATATTGFTSRTEDFLASAFNSTSKAAANQDFRLEAEPVGNNTTAPSATLNLLFGANGGTPAETGLSINNHGVIKFATGQTFPGSGGGTITSVAAGTDLTGGGTTGAVTLNLDTTKVPQLNAANMFTGNQTITGALTVSNAITAGAGTFAGNVSASNLLLPVTTGTTSGIIYVGGNPFIHAAGNPTNAFIGWMAGNFKNQGDDNLGFGRLSLNANTTGVANIALGYSSLPANTTGQQNVAIGAFAGLSNTTGNYNTFVGPGANSTGTVSNSTAIGSNAVVGASNALVLGGTGGNAVNVGIGTSTPPYPLTLQADDNGSTRGGPHQFMIQGHSDPNKQLLIGYLADNGPDNGYGALQATWAGHYNTALALNPNGGQVFVGIRSSFSGAPFAIGQGQGSALADGWTTYSSRRWKTNIQTLPNALSQVERLRGVSYDLKENGKHEIGVIAEEVGKVLPEIVSWDKNGKDANGVDYTRLTAVLIEAVKQQQHEIEQKDAAIRNLEKRQEAFFREESAAIRELRTELRTTRQALERVKAGQASSEFTLISSK